mmetsp:Transcript_144034/g.251366  ORF Transcript_144034/g.251366 Transcript_144034/m.251366 type:complete len:201 (-) Transcript_144034:65-667(-)
MAQHPPLRQHLECSERTLRPTLCMPVAPWVPCPPCRPGRTSARGGAHVAPGPLARSKRGISGRGPSGPAPSLVPRRWLCPGTDSRTSPVGEAGIADVGATPPPAPWTWTHGPPTPLGQHGRTNDQFGITCGGVRGAYLRAPPQGSGVGRSPAHRSLGGGLVSPSTLGTSPSTPEATPRVLGGVYRVAGVIPKVLGWLLGY